MTLLLSVGVSIAVFSSKANAAKLTSRSLTLSTPQRSATNVNYAFNFTIPTIDVLGSVQFKFCEESALAEDGCTAPAGLDASAAVLNSQFGETGFGVDALTDANTIVISRTPGFNASSNEAVAYSFGSITNPNANRTYYARISTFASNNATGIFTNFGGLAFSINNRLDVATEVPSMLEFCVGITINGFDCSTANGNFIGLGNLSRTVTSTATSQFVTGSNAISGFHVNVYGPTMTSGNNVIPALTAPTSSETGKSQFGINLTANSSPSLGSAQSGPGSAIVLPDYDNANQFMYRDTDAVVSSASRSDWNKFTVSYITNVHKDQAPGVYSTTLTYICLANF